MPIWKKIVDTTAVALKPTGQASIAMPITCLGDIDSSFSKAVEKLFTQAFNCTTGCPGRTALPC